jgi:limonene-1,2-epoxide hydrolase
LTNDTTQSEPTAAAVAAHVDAFNRHSTEDLIRGLAENIVWATGADVFRGIQELRQLFDDGLWSMDPLLHVKAIITEGGHAAAELHETLTVDGEDRAFDIAAFFTVSDGLIHTARVYRAGSADIA